MAQTIKSAKQEIKAIAKLFGVKLRFKPMKNCGGWYDKNLGTIALPLALKESNRGTRACRLYCNFFHELQHHVGYCAGKFANYFSQDRIKRYRLSLRAERWTDKGAKSLCNLWKPGVKYLWGYSYRYQGKKHHQQFLRWWYIRDVQKPEG